MMKKLLFAFAFFTHLFAFAQFPNSINSTLLPSSGGQILDVIDYDNDSYEDVVYQNGPSGNLEIYRNMGGTFSKVTASLGFPVIVGNGQGSEGVISFDYNTDGYQDLLVMGAETFGYFRLFKNNCGKSFTEVSTAMNMPSNPNIVSQYLTRDPMVLINDYDKDNDLDIVYVRFASGEYKISALKNGGTTYSAPVDLFTGFGSSTIPIISFFDYDNDMDDDLLAIKNTDVKQACEILLYENNGAGTFNLLGTTGLTNSSPVGFANITDYNQDGFNDIVLGTKDTVSPGPGNFGLKVFENNFGVGTFTDQTFSFNTIANLNGDYYRSHIFDVNNDGFNDVLWEFKRNDSIASASKLMINDGFNFFTNNHNTLISTAITDTSSKLKYTVFDYDNDGYQDIFVPGTASNAKMFQNTGGTTNSFLTLNLYSCSVEPIGARVYVRAGTYRGFQTYSSQGFSSDGTGKSEKLHFGLGGNSFVDSLVVYWPNGNISIETGFFANTEYNVVEGTCAIAQPVAFDFGIDTITYCDVDTAIVYAPSGYPKYLWSTGDTTNEGKATQSGWLSCKITFYGGCEITDSVYVKMAHGKIVQNDTTIIKGGTVFLEASPRYDCSPFGQAVYKKVSPGDDLGPTVSYVTTFNGHHYYVFNNPSDWTSAQRDALSLGGNLVVINSQEENDMIVQHPLLMNKNVWIGLYRSNNPDEAFRWVNCDPLNYTNWSLLFNSPSSVPNEQYVYLRGSGCVDGEKWKNNDETQFSPDPCESTFFGLLEFDNERATTYSWSTSETTPSITVSPTSSNSYFLEVKQDNSTCYGAVNITVLDPKDLISADSILECNLASVMVSANTMGWDSWIWNTSSTNTSITASTSGWYRITAQFGSSFGSDSVYVLLANSRILTPDTTLCANSDLYILGPVLPFTNQQAHRQNFEAGIFTNYNSTASFTYNGTKVFGPFANDSITYVMNSIPRHDSITVSFDLYIHDSWEGNCATVGEDRFKFKVNNNTLLSETFSNSVTCTQSYSNTGVSGNYPALTGAVASGLPQRCLSGSTSTKYTITKSFAHSASSLVFSWLGALHDTSANLAKCNESWSLDNIIINYRIPTKVLWSTGDTTQNIMVKATGLSTDYWIRIPVGSENVHCYDTVNVSTYPSSLPENLIEDDTIFGCNISLPINLSLPIGQPKYMWSTGDTLFDLNIYNEGWYYGYVEDNFGCSGLDSVYYFKNNFSLNVVGDTTICPGSNLTIATELRNNATSFPGPDLVGYTAGQALAGYTYLGEFRGHHYYQSNSPNSWETSLQKAFTVGGYLACINDPMEQDFINSITDSNVWIGLFKNRKGYYEWVNKDTLIYNNWGISQPKASPKDYAYIMGNSCSESGMWASHENTDPLATDPCQKDAYGLLEISSVDYSYEWSTGAISKDLTISPTSAESIWVAVTKTENNRSIICQSDIINVDMNASPIVTGIAQNCIGSNISYNTVLKPGRSYVWEVVGGTIVSGQFSNRIRVLWNTAGAGYVLLSDSVWATNCKTVSDTFHTNTIEVLPVNVSGLTSVCENQIANYSIPFDPELGMTWTVNGGTIMGGLGTENIIVQWLSPGTGNVTVDLVHTASGCTAPPSELFVDISNLPAPIISGNDTVCQNTTATYSSPANTGRLYNWSVTGGSITSGQGTATINVLWNTLGIGTVSLMDSVLATGCFATTNDYEVLVNALPAPVITGNNSVCENSISTYSIPSNTGRTYRWVVNGGIIISGQGTASINIVWGTAGTGDVQVSDSVNASGCKALSNVFNVNKNTNPQPVVSGKDAICRGVTETYSIPALSGHTYTWRVTLGNIVSGQGTASISVFWPISGSGTVEVTDSINLTGCKGTSPLMAVSINSNPTPVVSGKQLVCAGENASYSTPSNTGRTYTWTVNNGTITSGQGTATINVLWATAGSAYVAVRDSVNATGCAVGTSNYDVTVEANPSPVITGENNACESDIKVYSIPSNTGRTYNWVVSNGTIVSGQGTSDIQVLWGAFGSGSIIVSDSINASGCVGYSSMFNVNINIAPKPIITGSTSACINSTTSYNTPPSLGRTYTWVVTGGTIVSGAGTAGIEISWDNAGVGSIQVTDSVDATGCKGISTILFVNVQPKPSTFISGANSICENGTAMYGTIYNANKYYDWGVIGGNIDFGQGTSNITVTWTSVGPGYVYLTDSLLGSNCSAYAFMGVSVNPIPKASFTAAQSAGGVKLTPDEPNVSCRWYFGDGDSSYLYSPHHTYANNGIYTIALYTKSIYGCLNQSTMDVNITTVGMDGDMLGNNFKFNAQPNPFTEQTTLSLTLQESADISMDVYDMSGRLVHSFVKEENHKAGTYSFPFLAANHQTAGGVYLVRLKVGDEVRNLRIVEIGR
jgi:hypothetical protein